MNLVVTRVLTRYARSHHIGWHCNVCCWGEFRPLGLRPPRRARRDAPCEP